MIRQVRLALVLVYGGLVGAAGPFEEAYGQPTSVVRVHVAVGGSMLSGWAPPESTLTIRLANATGSEVGRWITASDSQGRFQLELGVRRPSDGAWIVSTTDAGFSLEIDYSVGDPVLIQVPPLSVHSDADRDVVEGMASPYATVLVEAIVDSTEPVTKTVAAGPSGRFLADFSGELDLEPPVSAGTATYSDDMGNQFFRGWSPPALTVWMGNSCMLSAAPTGLAGTSELRAAEGKVVGRAIVSAEGEIGFPGERQLCFRDGFGQGVPIRAGDSLSVQIGDERVQYQVPELTGRIDLRMNAVTGRANPRAAIHLIADNRAGVRRTVDFVASESGVFEHTFTDIDLIPGSRVTATYRDQRHTIRRFIDGPILTVDLQSGEITGTLAPLATARLVISRTGSAAWESPIVTNDAGDFEILARGADGRPMFMPQDEIVVETPDGVRHSEFVVPEVRLDLIEASNEVLGSAPPGSKVEIILAPWFDVAGHQSELAVDASGTFQFVIDRSRLILTPGTRGLLRLVTPSGHRAVWRTNTPLLSVLHGGSRVCGVVEPFSQVSLEAASSAGQAMSVSAADWEGWYVSDLLADASSPASLSAGHVVTLNWTGDHGNQGIRRLAVPEASVVVDWPIGYVQAAAPSGTIATLMYPYSDCTARGRSVQVREASLGVLPAAGIAEFRADSDSIPLFQQGLVTAFLTENRQRYYFQHSPVKVQAFLGEQRVAGQATPGMRINVTVTRAGSIVAQDDVRVESDGHFKSDLPGAAPDFALVTDDRIVCNGVSGSGYMAVEDLDLDFSARSGIVGHGPPNRDVVLVLDLGSFGYRSVNLRSAPDGRYAIGPAGLSDRLPWTFADVRTIEARLDQPSGHQTILRIALAGAYRPVYLPGVLRGR